MTRFTYTSLLALLAFFAIGASLHGYTRLGVYMLFWTLYLTVVGCGIAFIQLGFFAPAICRGPADRMRVALTFDDGPDPAATSALLDLLRRENIRATFFCIGRHVAAHPGLAARIHADGHLLANHTYHHGPWTAFMASRGLTEEITLTQQAVAAATGFTPLYFRPPVGLTNPHYPRALRKTGLTLVGWDVRSGDTFRPPQEVISRVLRQTRDGSIILLHDGGAHAQNLLHIVTEIIVSLRARRYSFERLDDLLANHVTPTPIPR